MYVAVTAVSPGGGKWGEVRTMEPLQPCRFGRLKSRFGGTLSSPDDSLV